MRRFLTLFLSAVSALALAACQNETDMTNAPLVKPSVFSADGIPHAQLPDTVIPQAYRIDMRMDPDADTMSGVVEIDVKLTEATQKIWLHGKTMTVPQASITYKDGQSFALTFTELPADQAPSGIAHLTSETELPEGDATIRMAYETPYNQALNSAYQVKRGDDAYIVTQMEPLGAREAFPGFDEPKYKVPFTLSITSPKEDVVYANTPKTLITDLGDGWVKHEFAKTRPLPTYLVAFGSGPYDINDFGEMPPNSIRQRPIKLRGLTARGSGDQIQYGLENTAGILTALEEYFGQEYPYEKLDLIAAPDYAFGAMENPGAIVYREYLMLLDENAPLSQKRAYARVHAHELAHQWFGNLVTPVWWEDIWLNEAFATWMGNKSLTLWKPDGGFDNVTLNASLGAMNIDTLSTTRKVREPLKRSENVMDQFDGITYRKGGGVLSMFESYLGEDKFRDGVRLHMKRYADDVATGDDFFQSIADGSGNADVVDAMKSFVDQPGLPLVNAKMTCEADKTIINLSQSRYAPLGSKTAQGQSWQIPVCVAYGKGDLQEKSCALMKDEKARITTDALGCADWMTPNSNGAGYYRFTLDSDAWSQLIANIDQLNIREVLTMQDSLVAAYRAGEVDSDIFLDGMATFAAHPNYEVASGSTRLLNFMSNELSDSQDDLARHIVKTYKSRFETSFGQDTIEGNLLAPSLASLLAGMGEDQEIRDLMITRGAQYLGLDGPAQKDKVASNILGLALSQAMRARPDAAKAPLLELAKNGSSLEKGVAIGALGSTTDADIAAELREIALNDMAAMTGRQALSLISNMMGNEALEAQTWDWVQENFVDFVTARVPDVRKGGMPGLASGFCSVEERDAAKAFFEKYASVIPGYERSLAQNIERIELCTALKDAKASELKAALAKR